MDTFFRGFYKCHPRHACFWRPARTTLWQIILDACRWTMQTSPSWRARRGKSVVGSWGLGGPCQNRALGIRV